MMRASSPSSSSEYDPVVASSLEKETLSSLAATVQSSVDIITSYLKEHNIPEPTFADLNSPTLPYVPELQKAKKHLVEATSALEALAQFHRIDYILKPAYAFAEPVGLRVVSYDYDIPNLMKDGEELHISEICRRAKCEDQFRMLTCMRICTQSYIFKESKPEYFTHTIYSVVLRDRPFTDYIALASNEVYRAVGEYTTTMKKFPNTQTPAEFPFNIAYKTPLPYFGWVSQPGNEEELRRFATGMQGVSRDSEDVITKVYPWKELGSTRLVDIGGSQGHVALAIGRANTDLDITIQDLPEVIENTTKDFPTDKLVQNGGKFLLEAHDAFTPQGREAETYFLRHILHDHPDDVSEKIIENILPQLKPWKKGTPRSEGSRVLICEMVIQPGSGKTLPPTDRKAVYMNICMNSLFNAQERTLAQMEALLQRVDKRFRTKLWGENGPQGTEIVEAWLEDEE